MSNEMIIQLQDRARLFQQVRAFFQARSVLEVDCPALAPAAPIDLHIDVMTVPLPGGGTGYLHTSPEYGMKRLLSMGIGDIYQMSHVFREGEIGPLHNPEFTMVEWYRQQLSFQELMEETVAFVELFLKPQPIRFIRYREALQEYVGIDYVQASVEELSECARLNGLDLHAGSWDKDTLLQLLVSFLVEPHLGVGRLDLLTHFPASQAALSKTTLIDDEPVAYRFEIYSQGIELANGYQELTDPLEQRRRLEASELARQAVGKSPLKIDECFLAALERGLPECCGVAVGFDRLMLLRHQGAQLKDILPFTWATSSLGQ